MVGLDNAGKTTILYQFLMNEVVHTSPTIGSNVEEIVWKNIHFLVWDLAGKLFCSIFVFLSDPIKWNLIWFCSCFGFKCTTYNSKFIRSWIWHCVKKVNLRSFPNMEFNFCRCLLFFPATMITFLWPNEWNWPTNMVMITVIINNWYNFLSLRFIHFALNQVNKVYGRRGVHIIQIQR